MGSTRTGDRPGPDGSRRRREPFDGVVLDADGRRIGLTSVALGGEGPAWLELASFMGEVGQLVWRVVRDPRVGRWQKLAAGAAVVYLASPIDVIPDMLPVVGRLDDLVIARQALRLLTESAGADVLREHWGGTDDGFALVMRVAGLS